MSLATRCPACSTVFRVVQDQLRVSGGWVRCGQCQEVFNALETLFDLGDGPLDAADTPPPLPSTGEPAAPQGTDAPDMVPAEDDDALVVDGPLPEDHWDLSEAGGQSHPAAVVEAPKTERRAPPADQVRPTATRGPSAAPAEAPAPAKPAKPPVPPAPPTAQDDSVAPGTDLRTARARRAAPTRDDDEPTPSRFVGPQPDWAAKPGRGHRHGNGGSKRPKPRLAAAAAKASDVGVAHEHQSIGARRRRRKPEFVRQAERAALWRRPAVRAVLGAAAGLLGLMLVLQVGYEYRDPLAAQVPALAPALRAGCAQLGCRIGAPLAIERIRLDASDLSRTEQDQVLRFTADLHNTADFAVRAPALEVSFTDALGRTVSRKVMRPAELDLHGDAIEADGQWRIDARLAVGELRIAGYTVEVFYP
jgi:predicted Zn finger-like uncharacterized protein